MITNEYLVKWYLFWDVLTENRTDGAMVRATMFLRAGECVAPHPIPLPGGEGNATPMRC